MIESMSVRASRAGGRRPMGRGWLMALLSAVVCLCGVASTAAAQWQKNKYQLEKEWAAQFEPSPLACECKANAAPEVMRVRFYADGEYRATGPWQEAIRRQLAEINGMLGPAFGVRLEVESLRRWERNGPNGALAGMLKELETLDAGADVDWVVGLVSPLPLVSMSFHDLGIAGVLGRHFVVRGMSSVAELDDFNRHFPALDRDQREKIYGRRKAHKEMVVFLHEWAHTLGAFHVEDPTAVMGPGYSQRSSRFAAADAGLIAAGVQARVASRGADRVDWKPLREFLADTKSPAWRAPEVSALENHLQRLAALQPTPARPSASAGGSAISPAAAALGFKAPAPTPPSASPSASTPENPANSGAPLPGMQAALQALNEGRLAEARPAIEKELRGSPRAPEVLVAACELELRSNKVDKAARHCQAAIAAQDSNARAHHLMGRIHHHRRKPDEAIAALTRSIKLDPRDRAAWEMLGTVYRSLGRSREYRQFLIDNAEIAPAQ